jgi:hypothetical protein
MSSLLKFGNEIVYVWKVVDFIHVENKTKRSKYSQFSKAERVREEERQLNGVSLSA